MYLDVTLPTWITELLQVIVSAFTTIGQGILTFVKNGFVWLFCEYTTNAETGVITVTGLSTFAIYSFVLMSIAIVMGLTAFITNLVRRSR